MSEFLHNVSVLFQSLHSGQVALISAVITMFLLLGLIVALCRTAIWKKRYRSAMVHVAVQEERLNLEKEHAAEKVAFLESTAGRIRYQFETLAQQVIDDKSKTFARLSSEHLDGLLQPLQEQLRQFKGTFEQAFLEETRDHASLKQELRHLHELNRKITEEASNLTKAISGDRKLQGTWGELVLKKLLEHSGLRPGHEFDIQMSLRDEQNRLLRPDIIVRLPEQRDIVIDSKVSLSAWTRYVEAADDTARNSALTAHLDALRNHLKSLAAKDYSSLKGLRSLDFVLMFIPIDAALITALQFDDRLIGDMFSGRVIIVTPTTLLATLRTIEHFWKVDRQNRNALEIAERAGALYDKLSGFLDDLERLGKQIDTCKDTYDKAMIKMCRGRGNLLVQAEKFPQLGVKVKTELPRSLVDQMDDSA